MLWWSVPALPLFLFTVAQAAYRVPGLKTLSIRLNHTPPFTPFMRASSMRSVQIDCSTQSHFSGRVSPGCLASFRTPPGLTSSHLAKAHPPSYTPLLHGHY